jgi:hypothetical protein
VLTYFFPSGAADFNANMQEAAMSRLALRGIPAHPGTYNLQITAADINGKTITCDFALRISAPSPAMVGTTAPPVIDNESFSFADNDLGFFPAQVVVVGHVESEGSESTPPIFISRA